MTHRPFAVGAGYVYSCKLLVRVAEDFVEPLYTFETRFVSCCAYALKHRETAEEIIECL